MRLFTISGARIVFIMIWGLKFGVWRPCRIWIISPAFCLARRDGTLEMMDGHHELLMKFGIMLRRDALGLTTRILLMTKVM